MPEFNKINVTNELLNVKYNFASASVLDLADIVFCIELLYTCTEQSFLSTHADRHAVDISFTVCLCVCVCCLLYTSDAADE